MRKMSIAAVLSASFLMAACSGGESGGSGNEKLRLANFLGPDAAQSRVIKSWSDEISSESDISISSFDSGTLIGAPDMLPGVANGQADMGLVTAQYFPAELPLSQAGTIPFATSNDAAQVAALTELYDTNEAFRGEWQKQGVEVLFFVPTSGPSVIGTNFPFAKPDDLKGKTIRAAGLLSQTVQESGGSVAALPAAELYESVQRGVVDGWTAISWNNMVDFSLGEVTSHVTDAGLGNITVVAVIVNKAKWDQLDEGTQALMMSAAENTVATSAEVTDELSRETCGTLQSEGVELNVLDATVVADWKESVQPGLVEEWKKVASKSEGNPDEFWNDYVSLLEKHSSKGKDITQVADCLDSK